MSVLGPRLISGKTKNDMNHNIQNIIDKSSLRIERGQPRRICYSCGTKKSTKWKQSVSWPDLYSCSECTNNKIQCQSCYKLGPLKKSSFHNKSSLESIMPICKDCSSLGIVDNNSDLETIGTVAITWMGEALGLDFQGNVINLKLVELNSNEFDGLSNHQTCYEKKEEQRNNGKIGDQNSTNKKCLGKTLCRKKSQKNGMYQYQVSEVRIPSGLPAPLVECVLIHELFHAWLWIIRNDNDFQIISNDKEEILCDAVASLYVYWRIEMLTEQKSKFLFNQHRSATRIGSEQRKVKSSKLECGYNTNNSNHYSATNNNNDNLSNYLVLLSFRLRTLLGLKLCQHIDAKKTKRGYEVYNCVKDIRNAGASFGTNFILSTMTVSAFDQLRKKCPELRRTKTFYTQYINPITKVDTTRHNKNDVLKNATQNNETRQKNTSFKRSHGALQFETNYLKSNYNQYQTKIK